MPSVPPPLVAPLAAVLGILRMYGLAVRSSHGSCTVRSSAVRTSHPLISDPIGFDGIKITSTIQDYMPLHGSASTIRIRPKNTLIWHFYISDDKDTF